MNQLPTTANLAPLCAIEGIPLVEVVGSADVTGGPDFLFPTIMNDSGKKSSMPNTALHCNCTTCA